MPRVTFTEHLERHLSCPPREAEGKTVGDVLNHVFRDHPRLKGYLLDDQGHLRQHVTVFVDGRMVRDRKGLTDATSADSEIYVMQALSGG